MTNIEICCKGMETMIQDGTIQPAQLALGHQTAQVVTQQIFLNCISAPLTHYGYCINKNYP
jgi:hypothetical protein